MFSNFLRILLVITSFAPILVSYWLIHLFQCLRGLRIYFSADSLKDGLLNFLSHHWSIILFFLMVLLARFFLKKAISNLAISTIDIKSFKPSDSTGFSPLLLSYFFPLSKFFVDDYILLIGALFYYTLLIVIYKGSFHYNLILRIFFGYRNYEIVTTGEASYSLLSKQQIVNRQQVKEYVQLTDYMIIHIPNKK